jgi:hypothetical protein
VAPLAHDQLARQGLAPTGVHPAGPGDGLGPGDDLVGRAQGAEPARARQADGARRHLRLGRDLGPPGREVDDLALVDAEDGVQAAARQRGQVGERAEAAVGQQDVAAVELAVHGVDAGRVVRAERGATAWARSPVAMSTRTSSRATR